MPPTPPKKKKQAPVKEKKERDCFMLKEVCPNAYTCIPVRRGLMTARTVLLKVQTYFAAK